MYDTTEIFRITKDDVLKYVTEYDIFCQYMGFRPIVGKLYSSPTRRDSMPSFGLFYARNGNLLFKDFGTGESGNCFKLASIMDNVKISEVYKSLYKQYSSKKVIKKTKSIPVRKTKKIDIVVEKMEFSEAGLRFWAEFGISLSTLEYFKVSQVSKFWSNGRLYGYGTEKNPIFHYEVYDADKIYRPFHKTLRFYSNCTMYDVQGWEQIDYSRDTIFITKSLKDVMALYELGYTAVAPNGEGHAIPKKALKILKENFKYVIVLYDKDPAGMKGARRILKENPTFGFMFTPSREVKDISDYLKANGKTKSQSLISKKLKHVKEKHCRVRP